MEVEEVKAHTFVSFGLARVLFVTSLEFSYTLVFMRACVLGGEWGRRRRWKTRGEMGKLGRKGVSVGCFRSRVNRVGRLDIVLMFFAPIAKVFLLSSLWLGVLLGGRVQR